MRSIVIMMQTGVRRIAGTDWPVTDVVVRNGPRAWTVVRAQCNGVPDGATTYRTRREAMAAFRHVEGEAPAALLEELVQ